MGEADAVDDHVAVLYRSCSAASAEDVNAVRQRQVLGDNRLRIVVPADHEDPNARLGQPVHLGAEEHRGFHAPEIAVVEIAGNHQCIDLFLEAEIDGSFESLSGGTANHSSDFGIAQRERPQRRVEMNIGGMDEAERHFDSSPYPANAAIPVCARPRISAWTSCVPS